MIETQGQRRTSAHYSRLGQQECEKIHRASIEMLEHVGVEVHDEKALKLLVKGGAKADGIVVRIPELMVLKALAVTPRGLTLFDQKGEIAIRAQGNNTWSVSREDLDRLLVRPEQVMTRVRAILYQDRGFKVFATRPGSLLHRSSRDQP